MNPNARRAFIVRDAATPRWPPNSRPPSAAPPCTDCSTWNLFHLILIRRRAGRIAEWAAERAYRVLLRLCIRFRLGQVEAEVRAELGDVLRVLGRHAESVNQVERGLATFDRLDDYRIYAQVLNTLGRARLDAGDRPGAETAFRRALERGKGVSQPYEIARAHLGLGDCQTDREEARAHWRAAAEIFDRLRVPERHDAAGRLQEVDSQKDETGVSHCAI